ncbi:MAG: hypothetical protein ACK47E_09205 [Cyclobacteriaceae bacterium]
MTSFHFFIDNLLEPVSYGLCFLFILWHVRHDKHPKWKALIVYYFVASLLMWKAAYAYPNLMLYSLLCLLSGIGIGIYFYYTLKPVVKKGIVIAFIALQAGYYLIDITQAEPPKVFDSLGYVMLSVGVVLMSFLFMHQILTNVTEEPLSWNFDFWFVSSQFFYYLGSFFIFLTYGYFTEKLISSPEYSKDNLFYIRQLWLGHNVLLFLSALVIAGSLLWISFRRKPPSSL